MRGVTARDNPDLQGQLWTPNALRGMGLAGWYDASDLAFVQCDSGGGAAPWKDKFSNGNDATNGTAADRPPFSATGWPISRMPCFAPVGIDGLTAASSITATSITAVCVVECSSSASTRSMFGRNGGGGAAQLRWTSGHKLELLRNTQASLITSTNAVSTGTYHVVGCEAGTSFCAVYIDGVVTSNSTSPSFTAGINGIMTSQGPESLASLCGEIIICNVRLSAHDRQKLEGYAAWKWDGGRAGTLVGQLPVNHLYKSRPPTIGDAALRYRRPAGVTAPAAAAFYSRYYYDLKAA